MVGVSNIEMPEIKSTLYSILRRFKNLVGAGIHLLLIGVFTEAATLVVRTWFSFPLFLTLQLQIMLSAFLLAVCLSGMIWFNRTCNLAKVHLLNGKNELITCGPFAYVRHPLYATLLLTLPPLFIVWYSDLLFLIPWILIFILSHYVVRIEERGLIKLFGEDYQRYRERVPALFPLKRAFGKSVDKDCGVCDPSCDV
jgi:protein-S-isoprenylcysteine O-methyltransferase Ste14